MSFKSKLNKMKNFLFDDEEVEEKPLKKEKKKKVKEVIPFEKEKVEEPKNDFEDLYFEDISEPKNEELFDSNSMSRVEKTEFKVPELTDEDFLVSRKKPEPIISDIIKKEEPVLYQGSRKRKEETKKFKPTPIISPIYGLLDSNGNTINEKKEKEDILNDTREVSLDDVRKKAYGKLDDEIEDTLKRLSKKTIAEAEQEMEEKELSKVNEQKKKKPEVFSSVGIDTNENEDDEEPDMILPNVNFKEIDIDKERGKKSKKKQESKEEKQTQDDDDDDDTKEQDLFNLIDSMYSKEGED